MNKLNKKVGVVILTYNRLELLKINLCKVFAQDYPLSEVLVVDNNSNDGTREYLDSMAVSKLYLDNNLGPAGGFHEGIKYFGEKNEMDFLWLMDDDFFPLDSCLQQLLVGSDENTVNFPYVRDKDFSSLKEPAWSGVLIPMNIIRRVGYPRKDLFFWFEDAEYFQSRIQDMYKYSLRFIPAAKGVHFKTRVTNFRQPWRYYYEIRNNIYARLYVKQMTTRRAYKLVKGWIKLFGKIVLKENNKMEKMKWFLIGTVHGIYKKLGKTVDPQTGTWTK